MDSEKSKSVRVDAMIPRTQRDEFVNRLPIHGSTTWLIQLSFEAVLEVLREDPDLAERLKRAIRNRVRNAA